MKIRLSLVAVILLLMATPPFSSPPVVTAQSPSTARVEVTLHLNRLICHHAQETRLISFDGEGDEIYLLYQLIERTDTGETGIIGLQAFGIMRLRADRSIAGERFRPVRIVIPATSRVVVRIQLMESDNYDDALRMLRDLDEQAGESTDGVRLRAPSVVGETTAYSELFHMVTGVDLFALIATEDTLGEVEFTLSPGELEGFATGGVGLSRRVTFERDSFNNRYAYELKYAVTVTQTQNAGE